MSGLLVKEYYTLRRFLKQYILLFIFFGVLSVYLDSAIYFQAMVTMSMCMLVFTGMSYDAVAGWDKFVMTMPVSRKDVVLSKYTSCVIYAVGAIVVSTIFSFIINRIHPMENNGLILMVAVAATLLCLIFIIYSILLPMIFKLGVEKTRILMIAVIMIPVFLILGAADYLPETVLDFIEQHAAIFGAAGVIMSVLIYFISYFISVSIFNKKKF